MTKLIAVATLLGVALITPQSERSDLVVTDLRCEYATDPMGIDVAAPRLFWKVASDVGGARQTAYRILVATSRDLLARDEGDLWDSGRIASDETTHIAYAGKRLVSTQRVAWKVRAWDGADRASGMERAGLLDDGAARRDRLDRALDCRSSRSESPLFRREFAVNAHLSRATIHVSGLGQYELYVNGQKAGEDVLTPGWTKYDKTVLYDTRDVTALLRPGTNAIGLMLGKGMYRVDGGRYTKFKGSFGGLMAIAQLRLDYADGTTDAIATDERWRATAGPITFSCVYGGEDYDARKEPHRLELGGVR